MRAALFIIILALLLPVSGMACAMTETAQISVNWNGGSASIKDVRGKFDERMKKIEALAKEAGIEKLELQNQSYNINTNNNGYGDISGYQYNGSASYTVTPAEKAPDLLELLTKNKIQSSLNVNMYKSGSCQ